MANDSAAERPQHIVRTGNSKAVAWIAREVGWGIAPLHRWDVARLMGNSVEPRVGVSKKVWRKTSNNRMRIDWTLPTGDSRGGWHSRTSSLPRLLRRGTLPKNSRRRRHGLHLLRRLSLHHPLGPRQVQVVKAERRFQQSRLRE
jgi:hypothetical protein